MITETVVKDVFTACYVAPFSATVVKLIYLLYVNSARDRRHTVGAVVVDGCSCGKTLTLMCHGRIDS